MEDGKSSDATNDNNIKTQNDDKSSEGKKSKKEHKHHHKHKHKSKEKSSSRPKSSKKDDKKNESKTETDQKSNTNKNFSLDDEEKYLDNIIKKLITVNTYILPKLDYILINSQCKINDLSFFDAFI